MRAETASKSVFHDDTSIDSSETSEKARESSARAAASRPHPAPPGGGADDAWAEQYKRESGTHTVGTFLAVRAELMALLGDLTAVVRVYSALVSELARAPHRRLLYVLRSRSVPLGCVLLPIAGFGPVRLCELSGSSTSLAFSTVPSAREAPRWRTPNHQFPQAPHPTVPNPIIARRQTLG